MLLGRPPTRCDDARPGTSKLGCATPYTSPKGRQAAGGVRPAGPLRNAHE